MMRMFLSVPALTDGNGSIQIAQRLQLDPGGPAGLSAVVTFRADGSLPEVQVYFSTDSR